MATLPMKCWMQTNSYVVSYSLIDVEDLKGPNSNYCLILSSETVIKSYFDYTYKYTSSDIRVCIPIYTCKNDCDLVVDLTLFLTFTESRTGMNKTPIKT